jgi:hypothetical protein
VVYVRWNCDNNTVYPRVKSIEGVGEMIIETQKLHSSHYKMLRDLGRLVYHRKDQKGGLNESELNELLHIVSVEEVEKLFGKAYEKGFDAGVDDRF